MHTSNCRSILEYTYLQLHLAIVDLAAAGVGSSSCMTTVALFAIETLDDLHATLMREGDVLNRQALYIRLISRRSDTSEERS